MYPHVHDAWFLDISFLIAPELLQLISFALAHSHSKAGPLNGMCGGRNLFTASDLWFFRYPKVTTTGSWKKMIGKKKRLSKSSFKYLEESNPIFSKNLFPGWPTVTVRCKESTPGGVSTSIIKSLHRNEFLGRFLDFKAWICLLTPAVHLLVGKETTFHVLKFGPKSWSKAVGFVGNGGNKPFPSSHLPQRVLFIFSIPVYPAKSWNLKRWWISKFASSCFLCFIA